MFKHRMSRPRMMAKPHVECWISRAYWRYLGNIGSYEDIKDNIRVFRVTSAAYVTVV